MHLATSISLFGDITETFTSPFTFAEKPSCRDGSSVVAALDVQAQTFPTLERYGVVQKDAAGS